VVEIGSGRPFRYPQHAADFAVRKSFDVVQDDHRPLPLRQFAETGCEAAAKLVLLRRIAKR